MKRFIIAILLCVVCNMFADEDTIGWGKTVEIADWGYYFEKQDSVSLRVYDQKIITRENIYIAAPIFRLLQFYEEYKQECYNDSSMVYLDKGWSIIIEGKRVTEYWKHTEPTFQGYMEFLKKKFN